MQGWCNEFDAVVDDGEDSGGDVAGVSIVHVEDGVSGAYCSVSGTASEIGLDTCSDNSSDILDVYEGCAISVGRNSSRKKKRVVMTASAMASREMVKPRPLNMDVVFEEDMMDEKESAVQDMTRVMGVR
jgi:hypothetical protein